MKNIKINSKKEFVLCDGDQPIMEPEISIVQLSRNVFLFKGEKYLVKNYESSKQIEFIGNISFFPDYLRVTNDSEFVFYDSETLESNIKQTIGKSRYNIQKFNDYILYEGVVYNSNEILIDLAKIQGKVINTCMVWISEGILIITYIDGIADPAYLYCLNVDSGIVLDDIHDVKINCYNNYDEFSIITINEITYIFNSKGRLIFKGLIEDNNFDRGAQAFFYFKHNNQFYILFDEIIDSIDWIDSDFIEIYSSHDNFVLIYGKQLVMIDLLEKKLTIKECDITNLSIKEDNTKRGKSYLKVYKGIVSLLTDGTTNYFYNPNTESIEILNTTNIHPFIDNDRVCYIDSDFKLNKLDIMCERIVDYSYLRNDILLVLLINNEYNLMSIKRGIIKKSKQPLAFEYNFGSLVLINPQSGKLIESFYYNESDGKLKKFPAKLESVRVNNQRKNMYVTIKDAKNELLIHNGITPII